MRKTFIAASLAAAAAGVAAEPATFAIDPGHTIVTFEALHFNTSTQRSRSRPRKAPSSSTATPSRARPTSRSTSRP